MQNYYPAGTLADGALAARVEPDGQDWSYTGLLVIEIRPGVPYLLDLPGRESMVVPLSGSALVTVDGDDHPLAGRATPWAVTDVLYLPLGSTATITVSAPARIAIPFAVARRVFPLQYIPAAAVRSELRGRGICSRQVNNFGTPDVLKADRLIACEVMQPGGNWSSYPPHKHDVVGDQETRLEEIYYYEVAPSPVGTPGFALQRVYSSAAGEIDVTEEVRTGDLVLIPFGYHGPTVAAPGHDLYYLNVMAGPADPDREDRSWLISDDPAHAWIRSSWEHEEIDPRLPFAAANETDPDQNDTDENDTDEPNDPTHEKTEH